MAALRADGPAHGDSGFTLLEALIAITLLALAAGILQSALTGASRLGARAAGDTAALEIARAKLAAAGVATPLREGVTEGEAAGGYRWRVSVSRRRTDLRPQTSDVQGAAAGYWATAEVEWHEHGGTRPRTITLTTLKLADGEGRR